MAEGTGFEPADGLPHLLISSQMPLTTQPPFRCCQCILPAFAFRASSFAGLSRPTCSPWSMARGVTSESGLIICVLTNTATGRKRRLARSPDTPTPWRPESLSRRSWHGVPRSAFPVRARGGSTPATAAPRSSAAWPAFPAWPGCRALFHHPGCRASRPSSARW